MIDFILGIIVGGLAVIAVFHFTGRLSAKTDLTLSTLEQRIQKMLSDAFNAALARLEQVVDSKISASDTGAQVDAEATTAVNALADKIAAPADQPA